MRSLAVTPAGSRPSNRTRMVFGRRWISACVASTWVNSLEPMPNASAPSPPWVQVWLSPQTIRQPGRLRPSSGPITWTMPCPGSSTSNIRMPVADVSVRSPASSSSPTLLVPARPRAVEIA